MTPGTHTEQEISQDGIEVMSQPDCLVCGTSGRIIFEGLADRVYATPGSWNFRGCQNRACGVLWLDPMPTPADVWKAYREYYTHEDPSKMKVKQDFARRLFRSTMAIFKASYLNRRYGYGKNKSSENKENLRGLLLGWLAYAMPWRRSEWDLSVMFLPQLRDGRLLEVGCGNGAFIQEVSELGWKAEGLDVDPGAVEAARSKGLPVKLGSLEESRYPDGYFDAICMCHVIEHVHDPVRLFRECFRVLKPGGRLCLVTPNAQSFYRRSFGDSWFALEPPRHLHIFTVNTLRILLQKAGFRAARVFTTVRDADGLFVASRSIRRTGRCPMNAKVARAEKIYGRIAQLCEWLLIKTNPCAGEELSAIAQK